MNELKTVILSVVVMSFGIFIVWCGRPSESEKNEEGASQVDERQEEGVEAGKTVSLPQEITNSIGMKLRLIQRANSWWVLYLEITKPLTSKVRITL
jgi:hypothetical protein